MKNEYFNILHSDILIAYKYLHVSVYVLQINHVKNIQQIVQQKLEIY